MASTTVLTTNEHELHTITHKGHIVYKPDAPSNSVTTNASNRSRSPRSALEDLTVQQEPSDDAPLSSAVTPVRPARANLITFQMSLVNFLSSFINGLITVGLPRIAADTQLPERLYLWPSSVYGLTTGSCLLLAGAIADVIGPKSVDLVGCAFLSAFTLGCGLSGTGIQFVVFRAFQGLGSAMHLPCSVSLVTQFLPSGKRRNIGFACLGLSMPLGFSVGLVLGGIFVDTVGWRVGFYIATAILFAHTIVGSRVIPAVKRPENVLHKLKTEIDWIGATLACAGLAMFSYVLALLSTNSNNIRQPAAIAMLVVSVLLIIIFPLWMRVQTSGGRPALIPNRLWRNLPFSCVCALTVLTWGVQNSMELFSSLYFQEVQEFSALQASIRIVPCMVVAVLLNLSTGYFVDRAPTFWLVLITTILTAGSPLLMALINPHWSYWKGAFFAQILAPISGDVLFTVGLIIVSDVFQEKEQALAGAVYNTVAYFGMSLGLNLMQVVSILVTQSTHFRDKSSPTALLKGYQASFWAMFAATLACAVVCALGLRRVGSIGLKRD